MRGLRTALTPAAIGVAICAALPAPSAGTRPAIPPNGKPMSTPAISYQAVPFTDLPGWQSDDHLAAWKAFLASCRQVSDAARAGGKSGPAPFPSGLLEACDLALAITGDGKLQTRAGARAFFETYFRPHSVIHGGPPGLLTGYYEPLLKGSRTQDATYPVPVYRRPPDLVNMVAESERGAKSAGFTHMRRTDDAGLVPHLTRAEIEQGGLDGQGLELMYFRDPVDVFFMHVQGSGRVELEDGKKVRITYDGKNGYPYTSVGRVLIEQGQIAPGNVTLKSLKTWLRADRERGKTAMWHNESFVFFRELEGAEAEAAMGAMYIPLQPGRSLAVDTAYHALGLPVFVSSPTLDTVAKAGFNRLMIAHDVGSAIKGPERGDLYYGSGDAAGRLAGITKHQGKFFVFLPIESALSAKAAGVTP